MRNRPIILVLALLQTVGCWSSWSRTDGGATDGSTDDSPDSPPCTPRLADRETYYQLVSDEPPYPHVDLAWTDDRWLFVYRTDPGLPLHGLWYIGMFPDGSLQVVGHVPGSESCHHPLAVWNGETALITCDNDTGRVEIESRERSVDPYESLGSARLVHPEDEVVWGIQSALAWTGTHAVVAWPYQTTGPNADGVAVQFLEGDGTRHGSPVRLADGYTGHPDVQGLDGRAAVLWLGGSTYLSIIEPDGTIVSQTEVGSDATIGRHLAVGPHAMAMVWSEDGFHFRLLDLDGVPSGEPVEVAGRNAATASAAIDWTV